MPKLLRWSLIQGAGALAVALLALVLAPGPVARAQDVAPASPAAVEATLRLSPVQDSFIDSLKATANYGSETVLEVQDTVPVAAPNRAAALLQFDLSNLPPGTTIHSATLRLWQTEAAQPDGITTPWQLSVFALSQGWDESTVTWASQPPIFTGFPAIPFSSPLDSDVEVTADLTALVNNWVNNANFPDVGLEVSGVSPTRAGSWLRRFSSREGVRPPRLEISYTLPPIRVCVEDLPSGCDGAGGAIVHNLTTGQSYTADVSGYISPTTPIGLGHTLWARFLVDPFQFGFNGTLYATMANPAPVNGDSFLAYAGEAGLTMRLTVTEQKPLWLQNLDMSAQWHVQGDPVRAARLREQIIDASDFLYEFTDGQFALGTVLVRQSYDGWDNAHVQIYGNNTLQPKADIGGIVTSELLDFDPTVPISYTPGVVSMGSYWNRFGSPPNQLNVFDGEVYSEDEMVDDWSLALAHEFGHYLLYLFDTYTGVDGASSIELTELCTGTAMGDVYKATNQGFIFSPDFWATNCSGTEAFAKHNGRTEWSTIQGWYGWAVQPTEFLPGPANPPVPLTQVIFLPPNSPPNAQAAQLFDLIYQDGELSSGEARAFLLRDERVIEQGKPAKDSTQVQLTGAEVGDRLCVYDINDHAEEDELPRHQFGCEFIVAGDDTLVMTKNPAWSPEVALRQVGPNALQLVITQTVPGPGLEVRARLYPEHKMGMPEIVVPQVGGVYSLTINLPEPVEPLYVQLYVNEEPALPGTRREVIADRGTGGGGAFGPARIYGGTLIYSSDGNASFEPDADIDLEAGHSIAWQSMPGTPPLPFHKRISGQSYRLDAFPEALAENGTVRIKFVEEFGVLAAGATLPDAPAANAQLYFWDGKAWKPLATTLTTPAGATDGSRLASADSQGVGVYAVLVDAPAGENQFLPVILRQ